MRRHRSSPSAREEGIVEIVLWRRRRLERAGFTGPLADALASDRRVDLHAMLELVDRGCPPELAARILAPLDAPPRGAA
jgi:hypothetical protein